ncbi:ketosynthase chain-length factor [Streptosporangium sp. NBC_01755]|uniref:ketosynthase chain-length factor n=1 Tax=unclassified Streptosporangium TaxID=2632669 RepID=UPI002DD94B0C|nr:MULTISPECIES: ketosynthase chain-length factor [unclassified Streptosporangium]WSA25678.1 ketosynthase chain-length factor [Streptosporangium sp. NBC_01810]WSD02932.1 ketosynthase chain-length factor [Streptosporangium sp. NBC_01755]
MRGAAPVVTGIGVVAPTGLGVEEHWSTTLRGRRRVGRITKFDASSYPVSLAGEIEDFTAAGNVPGRLIPQTDHWTHMALVATDMALSDAGVNPADLPEYEMGVVTASSSGGVEFGQREIQELWHKGPRHVGAYQSIAWFYAATTGQISIRHGMRGPCGVVVAEQAGALESLAQARRVLRDGARLVVSGGTDAPFSPYGLTCQIAGGRLSTRTDPRRAYLPFDTDANGYVPGEGGAIILLEDAESARERGAEKVYGVIAGHAATFDPAPGSERPPTLRRAIENALIDADLEPRDVDVVFADAAGVPELDRAEAEAIAAVFGDRAVPVTAPKTITGRLYAGGPALDTVTALLSIRDSIIPMTVGVANPVPDYAIDLVTNEPRVVEIRTAMVLARGYGGFNAALVLRAPS